MKLRLILIACFAFAMVATGCKKNDSPVTPPVITVGDNFEHVEGLNVGDVVNLKVKVSAAAGIKRLAWYFVTRNANGTTAGTPATVDKTDYPTTLDQTITFTVAENFSELVITSFDKAHRHAEVHIKPENIRHSPILTFKDNIRFRESVFENKNLTIEGNITSEFDLKSLSYQTVINGVLSGENSIAITNKNMPFAVKLVAGKNLSAIIVKAVNQYNGLGVDTFKIGTVVDDDVIVTLANSQTNVPVVYAGIDNTLSGTIFSGSAVTNLTYAVKTNGSYGSEMPVAIGTPADEFTFSVSYAGTKGAQAIRITGHNAGNKTKTAEFNVSKVYSKLKVFRDVKLSSEIGAGKNNWFSAYQTPNVFDITNAAPVQTMMDLLFAKYADGDYRLMAPSIFDAGTAYKNAVQPYMVGFNKAPYTMVSTNRASLTPVVFNNLEWDGDMMNFLDTAVKNKENYNFYTTNRRYNNSFSTTQGFIIGWGQFSPINNQAFGIVIVKDFTKTSTGATLTLDIKVPDGDNRTKFNPVSILNYNP
ncbi:hypothetical protein [Filimonas effusa]|uniref:Uncharacterized protein n=1 Tax=Filimonas effusa TaxID=2508721 RepID=A0A4Q1D3X2_9BACT|nr:hypothetical protein [Filimonas effusa]RXK83105.1 hypothetical protein ESB13_13360 [Filimonas effusa]